MDDELQAMQKAASAVADLDEEARGRVLRWLFDKFGVTSAPRAATSGRGSESPASSEAGFAELFHQVQPSTDKARAVTAAYWLKMEGTLQFQSIELNNMLKDLGHGVSNITDALSAAMREKPALVIQIKKSGTARQARKLYKITDAGIKWVNERLGGGK